MAQKKPEKFLACVTARSIDADVDHTFPLSDTGFRFRPGMIFSQQILPDCLTKKKGAMKPPSAILSFRKLEAFPGSRLAVFLSFLDAGVSG
jgi:hypothetical protein